MNLIRLFLYALLALVIVLALALSVTNAQDSVCVVQPGGLTCETPDGRLCAINPDGTIGPCRALPPTPSSPIAGGQEYRVYLPRVEK